MQIRDIKNSSLKELFDEARYYDYSDTILAVAGDALKESNGDTELIINWQSKIESLHQETQHFWDELENIKQTPLYASFRHFEEQEYFPSGTRRELALQWIEEYAKDKGIGWSPLPHKPRTIKEYSAVFDRFMNEGYKVYAEFRDGRYDVYVKRRQ